MLIIVDVHLLSVVKTLSGGSAQDVEGVQASEISTSSPQKVRLCLQAIPPLPQLPLDWDKMTVIEIDYLVAGNLDQAP